LKPIENLRELLFRSSKRRKIFENVPKTSKLMLLTMVFCLCCAIGILGQLDSQTASPTKMWAGALYTGLFAVGYAWIATETSWIWMIPLFLAQTVVASPFFSYVQRHSSPGPAVPGAIKPWLRMNSLTAILLLIAAYVLTWAFITREGDRFFRTHTEIKLAGEIHKKLVATIDRQIAGYEFYGASLASGVVGGDLVDVIEQNDHWLAYVADVAGHGVSSGVLMAMIKSAAAMSMRFDPEAKSLLAGINEVLCSLKTSNMFATVGFLAWSPENGLRYSLAGHPPILRCGEEVQQLSSQNLPVGLFPNVIFESTAIDTPPGDVLAILTDGLMEVANRGGEELGLDPIASTLRRLKDSPLAEIAAAIFEQADKHGARTDDQSLLFVRRLN
jgi:Stage II sporulation protein E (SpoIIE)